MHKAFVLVAAGALAAVVQAGVTNDWENPAVDSRNRMEAAAYLERSSSEAVPAVLSLNGDWKFKWTGDPSRRPEGFWKVGFDDSKWCVIDVPSCVEMRGYGVPYYTNIDCPLKNASLKIQVRESGLANYNPVSSYRRKFTVPAGWEGGEIILRFDGVYCAYNVWVNGEKAGYAEDSYLPSEFNVTKLVKTGVENEIAVQVFRWCDGSCLDDQDMFRFSGIYRDVALLHRPKAGVADFWMEQTFDNNYKDATLALNVKTYGDAAKVEAVLKLNGKVVHEFAATKADLQGGVARWVALVKGVELWSAEKPVLYTLEIRCGNDRVVKRIGFKEVKTVGNAFYVNGRRVKLKGVNRHETSPENGSTVTRGEMIRDITLMKKYNINTVCTSHYPNHRDWYDLCDEYGIYVISETWKHIIAERNLRTLRFYRNHPCVIMWSMGDFREYRDIVYARPALTGGCVRDWAEQALWKKTGRIDPKTGLAERYLACGGDFESDPDGGSFCFSGIVDPLRSVTPKLVETGHLYRDLVVTKAEGGKLILENRYGFTSSDEFDGRWVLRSDGVEIASGAFTPPSVAPLTKGEFEIPAVAAAVAAIPDDRKGGELFLEVSFVTRNDSAYATKGWAVARNEIALSGEWKFLEKGAPAVKPSLVTLDQGDRLEVEMGRTTAVFSKKTGTLATLVLKGGIVAIQDPVAGIVAGPRLTCARAFAGNDRSIVKPRRHGDGRYEYGFFDSGLSQLSYHAEPFVVVSNTVKTVIDVTGSKGAGFRHECDYIFASDGSVTLENRVTPYGAMPRRLARLGLSMMLQPRLENMRYYGRGPEENYIDRSSASFFGVYRSTVTEQFVDYVRPQDNGYKTGVRWAEFFDRYGRGVRFSASEPMFMQALHYGWEDLYCAFSRGFQRPPLVPRREIMLNLDVRQHGLGGAGCGSEEKYTFDPSAPVSWSMKIEPLKGSR